MELYVILSKIKAHFTVMQDMDDAKEIVAQITSGVSFRGANLWVLIFAIFIASLGLNVNSTAVIIGAMLISPLMGPIIGMGLAIGINDLDLLRRSAKNFGVATLISVLTATFYFLITPLGEAQSELLARTSPTLYDVLIALCGGAAGIIAICTKGKGNVIPGVAIATALMPPLCTAGYGLATGHLLYFLGAFYLFFINTVFISFATFLGVRLMHFQRREFLSPDKALRTKRIIMGIVLLTIIPSVLMTIGIVRRSIFDNNVSRFMKNELSQAGTQLISHSFDNDAKTLNVVAVGKEINAAKQKEAVRRMSQYGLGKYSLEVIQGEQSDSLLRLNSQLSQATSSREDDRKQILELSSQVSVLSTQLAGYVNYESLAKEISTEVPSLFPAITTIGLSNMVENRCDTALAKRYVAAVVTLKPRTKLSDADAARLRSWLKSRAKADSLVVYVGR